MHLNNFYSIFLNTYLLNDKHDSEILIITTITKKDKLYKQQHN